MLCSRREHDSLDCGGDNHRCRKRNSRRRRGHIDRRTKLRFCHRRIMFCSVPTFRNHPSAAVCCHQFTDDRVELIWAEPLNWFTLGPGFQDVGNWRTRTIGLRGSESSWKKKMPYPRACTGRLWARVSMGTGSRSLVRSLSLLQSCAHTKRYGTLHGVTLETQRSMTTVSVGSRVSRRLRPVGLFGI